MSIEFISSLSFHEETLIANGVVNHLFEQNPLWDLLNIRIAVGKSERFILEFFWMTYCLHGDFIQSHCVPGYCQSLCLHDTCGFWREGFICHHCVALFYRVFVTGQGQHSKIQSYRFVIFCKYVDDFIVPFTNKVKCQNSKSNLSIMVVWGFMNQKFKPHNAINAVTCRQDGMAFPAKNIRNRLTS